METQMDKEKKNEIAVKKKGHFSMPIPVTYVSNLTVLLRLLYYQ